MKRKEAISLVALSFILLETGAILYAIWTTSFEEQKTKVDEIRVGVFTPFSQKKAKATWEKLNKAVVEKQDFFTLAPYFTSSIDELRTGCLEGTLDLLYINPVFFLELKAETEKLRKEKGSENFSKHVKGLYYKFLSREENSQNTAVLIQKNEKGHPQYITETKGKRITLSNKHSLEGFVLPDIYLKSKLGDNYSTWFSEVQYSITERQSFHELLDGDTDIIAIGFLEFQRLLRKTGNKYEDFHILWMSRRFPSDILCASSEGICWRKVGQSEGEPGEILENVTLTFNKLKNENKSKDLLLFNSIDYVYRKKLETFAEYLVDAGVLKYNK